MKKVILSIAISLLAATSFAQKVYQSGAYQNQKLRTSEKIEAVLVEKYVHNNFMWFKMTSNNSEIIVSIVNPDVYALAKPGEKIILDGCFPLSSRMWKRKSSISTSSNN